MLVSEFRQSLFFNALGPIYLRPLQHPELDCRIAPNNVHYAPSAQEEIVDLAQHIRDNDYILRAVDTVLAGVLNKLEICHAPDALKSVA